MVSPGLSAIVLSILILGTIRKAVVETKKATYARHNQIYYY
jgi:hypothetical protein